MPESTSLISKDFEFGVLTSWLSSTIWPHGALACSRTAREGSVAKVPLNESFRSICDPGVSTTSETDFVLGPVCFVLSVREYPFMLGSVFSMTMDTAAFPLSGNEGVGSLDMSVNGRGTVREERCKYAY